MDAEVPLTNFHRDEMLDGVTVLEALKLHSDIFGPQVGYWLN